MKRTAALAVGLLLSVAAAASADVPRFAVTKYHLANGLEVLLHEDHTLPLAYVSVWYHTGGGDDLSGKSGLAHLCEHMMFEGSRHVPPGEHFRVLGTAGNADANASTGSDRTNYFETVPSHELETALWLESDRMGYLLGTLDDERFGNQRDVVRNERRQRYENVAYGAEVFAIASALYPPGHPYRSLVIGTHEDLQLEALDDARTFFRRWYPPANATLLVAGDIDVTRTRALISKWFGSLPTRPRPVHELRPAPVLSSPRRETITDGFAGLRRIHYVWPTPVKALTDDDVKLDVLALLLGRTPIGRLYQTLVVDTQVAQSVSARHFARAMGGEFHVTVDVRPNASLLTVEQSLRNVIEQAATIKTDVRELRQAVAEMEVALVTDVERLEDRAEEMQSSNHYRGNPDVTSRLAVAQGMKPEDVMVFAKRFLGEGRVEIITMPGPTP
jgi:zinc protease